MPGAAITRLTTAYDPDEDRVALNCETGSGAALSFWLTRRLADRLLAALFDLAGAIDAGPSVPAIAEPFWRAQTQSTVQDAMLPLPPVAPAASTGQHLLKAVRIEPQPQVVSLVFQTATAPDATLALPLAQLLQWLKILHSNYQAAGWAYDGWPEWFLDVNRPPAAAAAIVLH